MLNELITKILPAFIPLFVALNAIGAVPFFVNYTQNAERERVKTIVLRSIFAALIMGIVFVLAGEYVLRFFGITLADFKIAGGLLLLVISIFALSKEEVKNKIPKEDISVVPLAIMLIRKGIFDLKKPWL